MALLLRYGLKFGVVKGAAMGGAVVLLDISFVKGILIAGLSAGIGAWGAIRAAETAAKEARANRDEIRQVKAGLNLDKRSTDQPPSPGPKEPPDAK